MKNRTIKVIIGIFIILIIGLFIHPQKVIYEPKIYGRVIDENGNPIENAIVSRIEEKTEKNKEWGYEESTEFKSQNTITDKNGNFFLEQKSRIDWFHTPLDLPIATCHTNFEISKNGYEKFKTNFGDFRKDRKKGSYACENIEFKPKITLKKNSR